VKRVLGNQQRGVADACLAAGNEFGELAAGKPALEQLLVSGRDGQGVQAAFRRRHLPAFTARAAKHLPVLDVGVGQHRVSGAAELRHKVVLGRLGKLLRIGLVQSATLEVGGRMRRGVAALQSPRLLAGMHPSVGDQGYVGGGNDQRLVRTEQVLGIDRLHRDRHRCGPLSAQGVGAGFECRGRNRRRSDSGRRDGRRGIRGPRRRGRVRRGAALGEEDLRQVLLARQRLLLPLRGLGGILLTRLLRDVGGGLTGHRAENVSAEAAQRAEQPGPAGDFSGDAGGLAGRGGGLPRGLCRLRIGNGLVHHVALVEYLLAAEIVVGDPDSLDRLEGLGLGYADDERQG
jgi:hypothetical protein